MSHPVKHHDMSTNGFRLISDRTVEPGNRSGLDPDLGFSALVLKENSETELGARVAGEGDSCGAEGHLGDARI